jgi:long-chain acyl-CoA synthetase
MNAAAFLSKAARQRAAAPAIVHGATTIDYEEFHSRALALGGNLLDRGLRSGDRVAFVLSNRPEVLETIFGCFAAGLVVVPINARLHAREIAYIVSNSGARALVHDPDYEAGITAHRPAFGPQLEHLVSTGPGGTASYDELLLPEKALDVHVETRPEDPCWLFYTSGTTGRPKGATWSHRVIRTVVMNYLADVHNIMPGEVVLHCAPMSHGSGIVALPAVARGAINLIMDTPSFDPNAVLKMVQDQEVGHIAFLAPTQIIKMLDDCDVAAYNLRSLRAICYGGAPIYVEQLRAAIQAFGPVFAQIYGQGEAPITITGLRAEAHAELLNAGDARIGSAGTVRTDVEACAVDDSGRQLPPGETGEIVVRGDVVMLGYWEDPEATAGAIRDGWLHTGDIGYFDERGYLFLLDRVKDMIISGGNNVYPREVEEALAEHPAVANVVVLGIPDDYWGEAVHAVVVLERGTHATDQELIDFCGESLAGYKKPKRVEFLEELPVSAYGKVLRRELRDRYWSGTDRRVAGGAGRPS